MNNLTWITNGFIDKELYGPFVVNRDFDYYEDIKIRYSILKKAALRAKADEESIKIIEKYTTKILESIRNYYHGKITSSQNIIQNLVKGCINNELAVSALQKCEAFGFNKSSEIQFFRARISESAIPYNSDEMMHLPIELRGKAKSERFSLQGVPSLYLSNTSYCCWIELGRPSEHDFCVSPCIVDGNLKVFNLAVMNRDIHALKNGAKDSVHCWLKLLILMIATSYRINEENRNFCSEYIVSQCVMMACKNLGLDGVVYYSSRVEDHLFAQAAINASFFVDYKNIYVKKSEISKHVNIGKSVNYQFYRQLKGNASNCNYDLKCLKTGLINTIGDYERYYNYGDTVFCSFDKFLFSEWEEKNNINFTTMNY